ncbi:MAG: MiaB/RimO family radical SAM methylthiotransferase [Deltaproteobacteria bacterium]|jgi:threonylcarbamoyladenosine tRNA methylthiotransferase MtaB|nr:MiaB/RimO family radical SAM methylthiotransferase [Deltaproteobacteria bacterium]
MKASIINMGCKVNQFESTAMLEMLKTQGYELSAPKDVDLVVLNTCAVTGKAESEAISILRRLRRHNPGAKVVGVGCLAQINPDRLRGLCDLILGQSQKSALSELLNMPSGTTLVSPKAEPVGDLGDPKPWRTRALHKIQDGCDSYCAYCAVPLARGPSRSSDLERVLSGLESYLNMGEKEVVLTGIHLGLWGKDLEPRLDLSTLLNETDRVLGQKLTNMRVRLSSLEPLEVPTIINALMEFDWLVPHVHTPIQSGSDSILTRMGRPYTREQVICLIVNLKLLMPHINIGTDILVGFPGETDDNFQETLELAEKLPFGYLHVFPFSSRPGTKASKLNEQISPEVKRARVSKLKKLDAVKRAEFLAPQIGNFREAIIENTPHRSGRLKVLTDNYIPALLQPDSKATPGQMVIIQLGQSQNPYGLAEAYL